MGCLTLEVGDFAYHWLVHFQYSVVEQLRDFWRMGHLAEISFYAIVLLFLSNMYGGMRLGYLKNMELIFSQVFSTILANIIIYFELSIMAHQAFVPRVFLVMMAEQIVIVVVYINVANRIYKSIFPPRKLFLVHGYRPVEDICSKFQSRRDKYEITRIVHIREGYKKICRMIADSYEREECNAVVIGDMSVEDRNLLLKFCYGRGKGAFAGAYFDQTLFLQGQDGLSYRRPADACLFYNLYFIDGFSGHVLAHFQFTADILVGLLFQGGMLHGLILSADGAVHGALHPVVVSELLDVPAMPVCRGCIAKDGMSYCRPPGFTMVSLQWCARESIWLAGLKVTA